MLKWTMVKTEMVKTLKTKCALLKDTDYKY